MSGPVVLLLTIATIALSAFFVAVEFALMAARRHRLEERAATSASARAAVRSSGELTLLLAGSQLGITACTLALGAITKPWVHHAITPALESLGLPHGTANVVSFVLALFIVTFLHLVIGEMAPKSWAIAHPEFAATVLALPMRAFMVLTRPMLRLLNGAANALVRGAGVEPVDEISIAGDPQAPAVGVDIDALGSRRLFPQRRSPPRTRPSRPSRARPRSPMCRRRPGAVVTCASWCATATPCAESCTSGTP